MAEHLPSQLCYLSLGLRSGFCEDRSRTWTLVSLKHFGTNLTIWAPVCVQPLPSCRQTLLHRSIFLVVSSDEGLAPRVLPRPQLGQVLSFHLFKYNEASALVASDLRTCLQTSAFLMLLCESLSSLCPLSVLVGHFTPKHVDRRNLPPS